MEINELLSVAKNTLNPRKLSKHASAGVVVAMITAGESRIIKMAATGVDDNGCGCAPCGRCREFVNSIHDENYLCEVILEDGSITTIGELLPHRL